MCFVPQFLLRCVYVWVRFSFFSWVLFSFHVSCAPRYAYSRRSRTMCVQYNRLLSMFFKKHNKSWTKVNSSHFRICFGCVSFLNLCTDRPVVSILYSIFIFNIRIFRGMIVLNFLFGCCQCMNTSVSSEHLDWFPTKFQTKSMEEKPCVIAQF